MLASRLLLVVLISIHPWRCHVPTLNLQKFEKPKCHTDLVLLDAHLRKWVEPYCFCTHPEQADGWNDLPSDKDVFVFSGWNDLLQLKQSRSNTRKYGRLHYICRSKSSHGCRCQQDMKMMGKAQPWGMGNGKWRRLSPFRDWSRITCKPEPDVSYIS